MLTQALDILNRTYGYPDFRPGQAEIIDNVLEGNDALVLMPTGGGKSLCYQLPAMVRDGVGIVVSPLIALMQDQVAALRTLGVSAAFLNSTQHSGEQIETINRLQRGELDLIYLAPERLLQRDTLALFDHLSIAVIAIDEAHCVSQWGHDFRQDYLGLHVLGDRFPNVPRIALTATANPRTRTEILTNLRLDDAQTFVSGFDRPNIRYTVETKSDAKAQLTGFLDAFKGDAGIIYCLSRRKVEETADFLRNNGFDALPYHAGLPADTRRRHQERFLRDDGVIVVATIAFGMGIDKPDVRFVAHLDLPKSVEGYYQETGRAGRDGEPAEAWMIYGLQDVVRLGQMLDQSDADEAHKRIERGKLDALLGWCEVTACRRNALLSYFGETHVEPCGNCDVCLTPPVTWDATVAAQKFLSCVLRTGQRYGAGHVIDVLRGKDTAKAQQNRHHTLSTFGIGADVSEPQWRSLARQLVVHGYLRSDPERFGALVVQQAARDLLKGNIELMLREEKKSSKRRKRSAAPTELAAANATLFDQLKECRRQIAEEAGVPPYVVFHDKTLVDIANKQPANNAEFLALHGVGDAKLNKFGPAFLAIVAEYTGRIDVAPVETESHSVESGFDTHAASELTVPSDDFVDDDFAPEDFTDDEGPRAEYFE